MGRWSREELEEEFEKYQARALKAATSHDWREWADQFTEDATYIEHHYGKLGGREAIHNWIQSTMDEWPNNEMIHFPIEWYVMDEEKGWIVCQVWNRFADPATARSIRSTTSRCSSTRATGSGSTKRTSTTRPTSPRWSRATCGGRRSSRAMTDEPMSR